jgi:hypothetical protein
LGFSHADFSIVRAVCATQPREDVAPTTLSTLRGI